MKRYEGRREWHTTEVMVNGAPLNPRLDLRSHSPTGFEWGYGGIGPAQLALAVLADCVGDELAVHHYQTFKQTVVAGLPHRQWTLTEKQVREALRSAEQMQERS